jgi:hypothetical protein
MLKVKLLRRPGPVEGERVLAGFLVEGHADFGEHGTDIVCAGVSAIAQAALFGLQEILGGDLKSEKRDGYLEVLVDPGKAGGEGPKAILRAFELGVRAVGRSYPGTVEVRENVM